MTHNGSTGIDSNQLRTQNGFRKFDLNRLTTQKPSRIFSFKSTHDSKKIWNIDLNQVMTLWFESTVDFIDFFGLSLNFVDLFGHSTKCLDSNQLMTQAVSRRLESIQLMTQATFPGIGSESTHETHEFIYLALLGFHSFSLTFLGLSKFCWLYFGHSLNLLGLFGAIRLKCLASNHSKTQAVLLRLESI